MDELAQWKADNLEITGKFTRACARVRYLEAALRSAHTELTNHGHQELSECECAIARILNDSTDSGEVKCVHDLGSSEKTLKAILGEANPGFHCTVCGARWVATGMRSRYAVDGEVK